MTLTVFAVGAFALPAVVGVNDSVQTPLETVEVVNVAGSLALAEADALFANINGTPLTTNEAQFVDGEGPYAAVILGAIGGVIGGWLGFQAGLKINAMKPGQNYERQATNVFVLGFAGAAAGGGYLGWRGFLIPGPF